VFVTTDKPAPHVPRLPPPASKPSLASCGIKMETGDQSRRAFLRSVISQIEIDDDKVKIIGDKATLAAVVAGATGTGNKCSCFCTQLARQD
jgi:hypothetical protein